MSLNSQQELFLDYLFNDPECLRDTKKACVKAGYEMSYHASLVRSLKDEILKRSSDEMAMAIPKAVNRVITSMDDDGSTPKGDLRLKAAESLLDRSGLAKKQEMDVKVDSSSPVFFIPSKSGQPIIEVE